MSEHIHIFHRHLPSHAIVCDPCAISFDHGRSIVKIELSCLITFWIWTWTLLTIFIFAFLDVINIYMYIFMSELWTYTYFHRHSRSHAILCDHCANSFDHGRSKVKIELLSCLIKFWKWTCTLLTISIFAFLEEINIYKFISEHIHIFHRHSPSLAIVCGHCAISFDHRRSIV